MDTASAASPTSTPHAPSEVITATDKRGLVVVIAAVFLSFVLSAFLTRLYIRLRVSGPWRSDDNVVAAATVLSITHASLLIAAVKNGFGLTIAAVDKIDLAAVGRLVYSSDIVYLVAILLTKSATILLFLRLSPSRLQTFVAYGILGLSIAWVVASIPAITVHCPPQFWIDNARTCPGEWARWIFVATVDFFTEAVLFLMSISLVWSLHMSLKVKITVITAFSVRLPVIAAAAVRLYYKNLEIYSADSTLSAANTTVWTMIELSYAVISCTLLCLGPFITPFEQTHNANNGRRPSYKLSALSRSTHDSSLRERPRLNSFNPPTFRPDNYNFRTNIAANRSRDRPAERASFGSRESQRMIINKQVEWVTTVENQGSTSSSSVMADADRARPQLERKLSATS